jgi:hypothetical protein
MIEEQMQAPIWSKVSEKRIERQDIHAEDAVLFNVETARYHGKKNGISDGKCKPFLPSIALMQALN